MPKLTEEQVEKRRRLILDAAAACFSRRGIRDTAMNDICREARVVSATLYRYFGGKEGVVLAVAEEVLRKDAALFESLSADGERIEGLSSPRESRLRLELWMEAVRDPVLGDLVREWLEEGMETVQRTLETYRGEVDNGSKPEPDTETRDAETRDAETRKAVSLFLGSVLCAGLLGDPKQRRT